MYLQDDEELVARLSLHHYFLAILKLHRLQGISHCQTLPLVQRLCSGATLGQHLHSSGYIVYCSWQLFSKNDKQ